MKIIPKFENEFYNDGRGPELKRVKWLNDGISLIGFEFFNPDDEYSKENIKHLLLEKVEAFSMTSDEVPGNIILKKGSKAAIFRIEESKWLEQFNEYHLKVCSHYQIVLYDEIYDIICKEIQIGTGKNDK